MRGCLKSDFTNLTTNCSSSSNCQTCQGDGCNFESVGDVVECLKCDSRVDGSCVSNLNETQRVECPRTVGASGCYHLQTENQVKRGCVSDLSPATLEICQANDETCKICSGKGCNSRKSFQQCRVCNSSETVNCIRAPSAMPFKTCKNYEDECFVHVLNDTITRGCLWEEVSSTGATFQEDCKKTDLCEKCSNEENCNSKVVDGEFCLTCDSETDPSCRTNVTIAMRTQCPLAVKALGCYRFEDDGGAIVKRGCLNNITRYEIDHCRNGGDNCKTCLGNDCNAKVSFQQCRACSSKDSVTCIRAAGAMPIKTCKNYYDECFVHVANDTITRGCLGDQSSEQLVNFGEDCKNEDVCEKCSGEQNCNNKIVDGEFCLTCDSGSDRNCRTNVSIAMRAQCPLAIKPLGCYRLEDRGGKTVKRGCLSNVTHYEIDHCRKNGDNCKTCVGNDCNAKIGFQQCRVCSSKNSINCIRAPGAVPFRTCKRYEDECFVHVLNDTITRGCLNERVDGVSFQEDCKNGDLCEKCSNDKNCNNKIVDGEFCLTCDSQTDPNCRANVSIALRTQCPLAVKPLGCYRFEDEEGSIVKRGCLSSVTRDEIEHCRQEGDNCKTCLGNDCNSKTSFQQCRVCSSKESVNCIRAAYAMGSKTCKNYYDECFVHVNNDTITRGCLGESAQEGVNFQKDCENKDVCEKCSNEQKCNEKTVDGEFCLTCDSTTDPNCRTNVTFEMRAQCPLAVSPLGCYRFEDDGGEVVKRGCLSGVTQNEMEHCRREGANCKTCLGNDCNAKVSFQQCRSCSSVDDVKCIRSAGSVPSKVCQNYQDECFVHVTNDTITRGCLEEVPKFKEDCNNGDLCEKCANDKNCNKNKVDGEFCLTCDSQADSNCRTNVTIGMRTQCPLAVKPLGCYRYEDDGGAIVKRGCLSNVTQNEIDHCRQNGENCKACLGNDCNSKVSYQRCFSCNSDDDSNCPTEPSLTKEKVCKGYHDKCVTHHRHGLIQRGCLSEMDDAVTKDCEQNAENCNSCDENDRVCNDQRFLGEYCYVCDSRKDRYCASNVTESQSRICHSDARAGLQGCYLKIDTENNTVLRGCAAELGAIDQKVCSTNDDSCKVCHGHNCNRKLEFQRCFKCDSNATGANSTCISDERSFPEVTCKDYQDTCSTSLDASGHIHRGCSQDPAHENTEKSESCATNYCNGGVYPSDRQQCHQCNGTSDCYFVGSSDQILGYCRVYAEKAYCFVHYCKLNTFDWSTETHQGFSSSALGKESKSWLRERHGRVRTELA